jgi:hypothetical protein
VLEIEQVTGRIQADHILTQDQTQKKAGFHTSSGSSTAAVTSSAMSETRKKFVGPYSSHYAGAGTAANGVQ